MVNYGTDLVVMGGYSSGSGYSSSFYQLSVENGIFKWEKMKPELKNPRSSFVAMTIPDHLIEPSVKTEKKEDQPEGINKNCPVCLLEITGRRKALVPCGHSSICAECISVLIDGPIRHRKCPICRQTITQAIPLFF